MPASLQVQKKEYKNKKKFICVYGKYFNNAPIGTFTNNIRVFVIWGLCSHTSYDLPQDFFG